MSDPRPPSDLAGLDARIKEAEARRQRDERRADERAKGLSLAFRISTELVAGVAVGVAIGWALDKWLGTRPWLMVLFVVLGFVAGIFGMYRTVSGIGHGVGFRPAPGAKRAGDATTDGTKNEAAPPERRDRG
jgi:ATP synthase protein I